MLQRSRLLFLHSKLYSGVRKQTFLTNAYSCTEAWNSRSSSPILSKINLNDFYNVLDQNYTSKGVISATDVDIFANVINDSSYLDELRDLLHKLRISADTMSTLDSTHHATIRNYIDHGHIEDLIEILKEPLTYGIFLDDYTANILLDKLVTAGNYDDAATVASLVMLQEDFSNDITCALSQYACYKFALGYTPPPPPEPEPKKKKVEEIKIRVKYLRNPYFDDHFDIKDPLVAAGKTLAWMSERSNTNLNNNLQIIGWLYFKKYDKLLNACENLSKKEGSKLFAEVKDLVQKECESKPDDAEAVEKLGQCLSVLEKVSASEGTLEDALKDSIENAINKSQKQDIAAQVKLFQSWGEIREAKLNEQIQRLDRAKRLQLIQEKQDKLKEEEQKLWFFDNEDQIDLQIEDKESLVEERAQSKTVVTQSDENYVPPEIRPKKK